MFLSRTNTSALRPRDIHPAHKLIIFEKKRTKYSAEIAQLTADWRYCNSIGKPAFICQESFLFESQLNAVFEREWYKAGFWPSFMETYDVGPSVSEQSPIYATLQHGPYRLLPFWLARNGSKVVVATDRENANQCSALRNTESIQNYISALQKFGYESSKITSLLDSVSFIDVTCYQGLIQFLTNTKSGAIGVFLLDGNRSIRGSQDHIGALKLGAVEVDLKVRAGLLHLLAKLRKNIFYSICYWSTSSSGALIPNVDNKKLAFSDTNNSLGNLSSTVCDWIEGNILVLPAWESLLENIRVSNS